MKVGVEVKSLEVIVLSDTIFSSKTALAISHFYCPSARGSLHENKASFLTEQS